MLIMLCILIVIASNVIMHLIACWLFPYEKMKSLVAEELSQQ